jgi:hypothetical protein
MMESGLIGVAPAGRGIGGGTGNRVEGGPDEALAAVAIHHGRIGPPASRAVDKQDTFAFRGEMFVAPGEQRPQHGTEITAELGQDIFVPRGTIAVAPPLQESGPDQSREPAGQDVWRDPEASLKLAEAGDAVECIAQYQDAPPFADPVEATGDWTLHGGEADVLHDWITFNMKVT